MKKISFLAAFICLTLIPFLLPACNGQATTQGNTSTVSGNVIVLGVPAPMGFVNGAYTQKGLALAVNEINNAGGVDVAGTKYKFKLEILDTRDLDESVPVTDALLTVEKLILDKKADFIVGGPARSEAASAAMDITADYKKISIISVGCLTRSYNQKIATDPKKYKYAFRATGSSLDVVAESDNILAGIQKEKGFNKIYVIAQDVAAQRDMADRLVADLGNTGTWDILSEDFFPTGSSDFSISLLKAKNQGAQILYIAMDMPEATILFKQWADMKIPALPIGYMFSATDAGYWAATNGNCEYLTFCDPKAGLVATDKIPMSVSFVNAWKKAYNEEPGGLGCSTSYMVPYLLKDAIERAGTYKDADAVIKALEQTKMPATYGTLKFNPADHQIVYSDDPTVGGVPCWAQWQAGKRVIVYPSSIATGVIKYPPWMK